MLTFIRAMFTILGVAPLAFYLFGNQLFNKFATYFGVVKTGPLHDSQFYLALGLCFFIGLIGSMVSDFIFEIKRKLQNEKAEAEKSAAQLVEVVEATVAQTHEETHGEVLRSPKKKKPA